MVLKKRFFKNRKKQLATATMHLDNLVVDAVSYFTKYGDSAHKTSGWYLDDAHQTGKNKASFTWCKFMTSLIGTIESGYMFKFEDISRIYVTSDELFSIVVNDPDIIDEQFMDYINYSPNYCFKILNGKFPKRFLTVHRLLTDDIHL